MNVRVRMLEKVLTATKTYHKGRSYPLHVRRAEAWIEKGYCEKVKSAEEDSNGG